MLEHCIAELSRDMGTAIPGPDEQGCYVLNFAGDHKVTCFERSGVIYMVSKVCTMPEQDIAAIHLQKKLMQVSLGMIQKSRAILSVDKESAELMLHLGYIPGPHNEQNFSTSMENFLNSLEVYKMHAADKPESSSSAANFMMLRP